MEAEDDRCRTIADARGKLRIRSGSVWPVRVLGLVALVLLPALAGCDSAFFRGPKLVEGLDFPVTADMEGDNRRYRALADQRVKQRFPPGSSVAAMKAELYAEGFRPFSKSLTPPPPSDPSLPHEIVTAETRLAAFNMDHRTLQIGWVTPRAPIPLCARGMTVMWTEDAAGRLVTVRGAVFDSCSG